MPEGKADEEQKQRYGRLYEWFTADEALRRLGPWAWKAFMLYLAFARFKPGQKWYGTVCHAGSDRPMTRAERAELVGVSVRSIKRIEDELSGQLPDEHYAKHKTRAVELIAFRKMPRAGKRRSAIAVNIKDFEHWRPPNDMEAASLSGAVDKEGASISIGKQVPYQPASDMDPASITRPLQGSKDARKEEETAADSYTQSNGQALLDEADRRVVGAFEPVAIELTDKERKALALSGAAKHAEASGYALADAARQVAEKLQLAQGKRRYLVADFNERVEVEPRPYYPERDSAQQEETEHRARAAHAAVKAWRPSPWQEVVAALEAEEHERCEEQEAWQERKRQAEAERLRAEERARQAAEKRFGALSEERQEELRAKAREAVPAFVRDSEQGAMLAKHKLVALVNAIAAGDVPFSPRAPETQEAIPDARG